MTPGRIYRIRLAARGPRGGAANFLQAGCIRKEDRPHPWEHPMPLIVHDEQIGEDWRRFEWTFRLPDDFPDRAILHVSTMSERPIEVRTVSLRESHFPVPRNPGRRLKPGQSVYRKCAELPALNAGDPPVAIYENLLWTEPGEAAAPGTPEAVEAFKRRACSLEIGGRDPDPAGRPDPREPASRPSILPAERPNVALTVPAEPHTSFRWIALPALGVFIACCLLGLWTVLRKPR